MAKRRIRFSLFDPDSLADAIREMQTVAENVPNYANAALNEIAEVGAQYAQSKVVAYQAMDTGNLYDSIHSEGVRPDERIAKVVADAWYAAYVEYGTGIVGSNKSHPNPDGWDYDINKHGEAGWWYYDWGYGRWMWTKGQPARPFMHETRLYLEQQAPKITAKVFRSL